MNMNKKLFKLMNWPEIEGIIYADEAHPEKVLGAHGKGNQTLVQAFFPNINQICVVTGQPEKTYSMECMDEDGFYAALVPGKIKTDYHYVVKYTEQESGKEKTAVFADPYAYSVPLSEHEKQKWKAGTHYHTYRMMGAHAARMGEVEGVLFRVWAPEAVRVSVVGPFNHYDGRVYPMILDEETGIFSLFIPGLSKDVPYQYEIRKKGGAIIVKADPYAGIMTDDDQGHYHICRGLETELSYKWKAPSVKKKEKSGKLPRLVYELDLNEFLSKARASGDYETELEKEVGFLSAMGYTHVALTSVLAENTDMRAVHEPLSFYALNQGFLEEKELFLLVDLFHEAGMYVIMDYSAACFCRAPELLNRYDGSCLYEHLDERQGYHPQFQVSLFHYGRPQVTDFLISGALRLLEVYHADGIRFCDTSFLLYLDYAKNEGEWIPNMYGGNENLEGIEFLKHCSSILKKLYPEALLITDEFSGWRNMTLPLSQDGFGFDEKWNYAYMNELLKYLAVNPINRSGHHHELTMSFLYQYLEKFMLALSRDYLDKCECGLMNIYGKDIPELWEAQKKLLYAYTMLHPGSKYFMKLFDEEYHTFIADCNHLYLEHPALYAMDDSQEGFEWINSISANECVLLFLRKCAGQTLLAAVNFANCSWENHKTGVPFDGKYKEIFNTDDVKYHGSGVGNPRILKSKKDECDMRENSIRITLAPLSVSVFEYIPYTQAELDQMKQKELEKRKKQEEARKKKERLKKEKEKIKASLKEELARKIAQAEEEIAMGSEYKQERGKKS